MSGGRVGGIARISHRRESPKEKIRILLLRPLRTVGVLEYLKDAHLGGSATF